jgi:TBC1 domain family protein 5
MATTPTAGTSKSAPAATTLTEEIRALFDTEFSVHKVIENIQRDAWQGKLTSLNLRALTWRLLLGLLPSSLPLESWSEHVRQQVLDYKILKDKEYPKMDRVSVDPLSALSNSSADDHDESQQQQTEWTKYYQDVELCNFILVDLDRLYMTGIDDEYFQSKSTRDCLLSVLFLWSARHPKISYRQGMHEIVGPIFYCVQAEFEAFSHADNKEAIQLLYPYIASCFNQEHYVEAHTYWLFERIMDELDILYDPNPPASSSSSSSASPSKLGNRNKHSTVDVALPHIVTFCAKVQEHFLRDLDPELCTHLEECFVQSQLYGMRWCRLLFGREISMTPSHGLRVWDYLFACCAMSPSNYYSYSHSRLEAEFGRVSRLSVATTFDETGATPGVNSSPCAGLSGLGGNRMDPEIQAMIAKKAAYTPLIAAVADIMLAMLLKVKASAAPICIM